MGAFIFPDLRNSNIKGNKMSVRPTIISVFTQVAEEQGKSIGRLDDDLVLLNSGLNSLGFAVVVARLDDELGLDPFNAEDDFAFPVTFGDFVKLYEQAAG